MPSEAECQNWNSRLMKHLMKQKMQKNDTFYVSKVLKGDNHFLRRQVNNSGPMQPRQQLANSAQRLSNTKRMVTMMDKKGR